MVVYELRNYVEVNTPKGRASVWLVTEYGPETPKLFTCIMRDSGEVWEFTNSQIRVTDNFTFGRVGKNVSGVGYSE
jgi:thymidine phosphorylase